MREPVVKTAEGRASLHASLELQKGWGERWVRGAWEWVPEGGWGWGHWKVLNKTNHAVIPTLKAVLQLRAAVWHGGRSVRAKSQVLLRSNWNDPSKAGENLGPQGQWSPEGEGLEL